MKQKHLTIKTKKFLSGSEEAQKAVGIDDLFCFRLA